MSEDAWSEPLLGLLSVSEVVCRVGGRHRSGHLDVPGSGMVEQRREVTQVSLPFVSFRYTYRFDVAFPQPRGGRGLPPARALPRRRVQSEYDWHGGGLTGCRGILVVQLPGEIRPDS
jgi:hypothetical protein